MNKQDFLDALAARLAGLPVGERAERLRFYAEMIDDRIEEGLSESEAVAEVGSPDTIAAQIISETPLLTIAKERIRPKRKLGVWELALLICGSPIWVPLLVSAVAVILSLYAVLWAGIVSFWSGCVALGGAFLGGLIKGGTLLFGGYIATGFAFFGMGLASLGLAIFGFFGCRAATVGVLRLTKACILRMKRVCLKKEVVK